MRERLTKSEMAIMEILWENMDLKCRQHFGSFQEWIFECSALFMALSGDMTSIIS